MNKLYDITAFELANNQENKSDIWSTYWWEQQGFIAREISQNEFMGWMTATTAISQYRGIEPFYVMGNPEVPNRIFMEIPPGEKYYEITRKEKNATDRRIIS